MLRFTTYFLLQFQIPKYYKMLQKKMFQTQYLNGTMKLYKIQKNIQMQKSTSYFPNYLHLLIRQNLKQKKNSDLHSSKRKLRVGLSYMLVHRIFGEITLAEIIKLKIRHSCTFMGSYSSMDLVLVFPPWLEILHFHRLIVAQKTFKPKQINMGSHMDLITQFLRQILQHCLEIGIIGKLKFFK